MNILALRDAINDHCIMRVPPGSHELPLQVTVPTGMQLVRQSPDKVRLRMYHEKLTTTADEHPS